MSDKTDWELLQEYRNHRSEDAFRDLTQRYLALVYSAALRQLGNRQSAEEVTQAVFILLARKSSSFTQTTVMSSWLLRTTRFTAQNLKTSQIRRQQRETQASELPSASSEECPWDAIAPHLDEAMEQLTEIDRSAITLRFFENRPLKEVGLALGVHPDAAGKRVIRALEKLRRILVRRNATLTAAGLGAALSSQAVQAAPATLLTTLAAGGSAVANAGPGSSLAHSTLKLMTWMKVKTSLLVGVTGLAITTGSVGIAVVALGGSPSKPDALGTRFALPPGPGKTLVGLGRGHGVILAPDGSLWAWGENTHGWPVMGLGPIKNQPTPRRLGSDQDWASIGVGDHHSLALKSQGTLWGWGENVHGQVGDGTSGRGDDQRDEPVASAPGNQWTALAVGSGSHSLAIKRDGSLWAWGNNWAGQLGIGDRQLPSTPDPIQVGTNRNWTRAWVGLLESVGQQADGTLWQWGGNPDPLIPQSGAGSQNLFSPVRVSSETNWVSVGFGPWTVLAVKSEGTLWAWGRMAQRYTGDLDTNHCRVPVQVGSQSDWQTIAPAGWWYQLLQKRDGSIWSLDAKPVENESTAWPAKPVQVAVPGRVVAFAAGAGPRLGVAINDSGEIWTWGRVLGVTSAPNRLLQGASRLARTVGWKVDLGAAEPVFQDPPWRLPLAE